MKTVRQNIDELNDALLAVKSHCMCAKFEETESKYLVIYPPGYFPDGVQASHVIGKAEALRRILIAMERHWQDARL